MQNYKWRPENNSKSGGKTDEPMNQSQQQQHVSGAGWWRHGHFWVAEGKKNATVSLAKKKRLFEVFYFLGSQPCPTASNQERWHRF